jgi:hypothetical protein
MVLEKLNDDPKAGRNEVSTEMLQRLETERDFLNRFITGDESLFFEYDPQTKRQSEDWHTPVSNTQESSHQKIKNQDNIHHFFFYCRGVIHRQPVPPGVTVNHKYYLEILDRLRKWVMRGPMEIANDWIPRASSGQRARTHSIVSS